MTSSSRDVSEVDDDIEMLKQQLEEIFLHNETSKGKHAEHKPPDSELAISTFQADVEAYLEVLSDQKFARSVAAALEQDATIIVQITCEEDSAQQDRQLALRISGGNINARSVQQRIEASINVSAAGAARRASRVTEDEVSLVRACLFLGLLQVYAPGNEVKRFWPTEKKTSLFAELCSEICYYSVSTSFRFNRMKTFLREDNYLTEETQSWQCRNIEPDVEVFEPSSALCARFGGRTFAILSLIVLVLMSN